MHPRRRYLLNFSFLLLVVGTAAAAGWTVAHTVRMTSGGGNTERGPTLTVLDDSLDFGEVLEDEKFGWTIQITNPGTEDLHVRDFSSSCTCTSITPESLVIPAGESRAVRLTLDLTHNTSNATPEETRDFTVYLAPVLDGEPPRRLDNWTLRGKVRPVLRLERASVDFGHTGEFEQPLTVQRVTTHASLPLERIEASCNSVDFTARMQRSGDDPARFVLSVQPSKELPVGPFSGRVTLHCFTKAAGPICVKSLPFSGTILSDLQASPPALGFGVRRVGETLEETVTLTSRTRRRFRVQAVEVQGDGFSAERINSAAPTAPSFCVKAAILSEGDVEGRFRAVAEYDGLGRRELLIPLRYRGQRAGAR